MLKEFKEFALKGNLLEIAVGLIMATAFGKVTNAFVDGIFMPLVGKIFQLGDLSQWKVVLDAASIGPDGKEIPEVAIQYGNLISGVINFLIIALVMFYIIKAMNSLRAPAAAGPSQEELLTQIRDLLKK
jgi:large conductance mechanosensitive channel